MIMRFSHYNQFREHGKKPHAVWLHHEDGYGSCRCLGYIMPTRWGAWEVDIDNGRGGKMNTECRTLSDARDACKRAWGVAPAPAAA